MEAETTPLPQSPPPGARPVVTMAVVMRKVALANRWQPWKWQLDAVLPDLGEFGTHAVCLEHDEHGARWLYPGFEVELFRDQGEGYYLNLTSTTPCWFVLWRMPEDEDGGGTGEDAHPVPMTVTLSYNEAGRWLDAGEIVENVPLAPEQRDWLQAYVNEHYRPEPKQRRRPESFKAPQDRARY
ncbi:DUF3305 domain-containing protein [Cupriavidus oxalaticus]|uniref:DUF3305 domain-containing protein n=1 Tax=Cupriavidus oxalaticus TaxID=96344 RepID=A0A4P7LDM4_9BURK|nr:DUF3305 domain-containing protein [Cupriavidus oxalaticus]QBY54060.1 DUF3305 domain-containing protein [Cupriavidus oxalaticus]